MNIFQSINAIMQNVPSIAKDRRNDQQGYKFRGIDDMYNALNPLLAEHGVFATSEVLQAEREERLSKNGGVLLYSVLTVKFTFYAMDGSFVTSTMIGEAMDNGDKASNKAMSTAYKYALMQLFCIPTEDIKDTEHDTHEVSPREAQAPRPTERRSSEDVPRRSNTAVPQGEPEEWLNVLNKAGEFTTLGLEYAERVYANEMTVKDIRKLFKLSRANAEALENWKPTKANPLSQEVDDDDLPF